MSVVEDFICLENKDPSKLRINIINKYEQSNKQQNTAKQRNSLQEWERKEKKLTVGITDAQCK